MIRIARWFSRASEACPLCEQPHRAMAGPGPIPLRHPAPRKQLEALCRDCRETIPWIVYPLCRVCGRGEACGDCKRRSVRYFEMCRCAVRYDDAMKNWLALYKYRGLEKLSPVLAAMVAFALERLGESLRHASGESNVIFHEITSVPLSRERLAERGFNQAENIARHLSEWYRIPYRPMLRRIRHTDKQSLKSRRSRVTDMKGIFAFDEDSRQSPAGCNLLLLDDVYTTGSTMNECARMLRGSSARPVVYGLTWAR